MFFTKDDRESVAMMLGAIARQSEFQIHTSKEIRELRLQIDRLESHIQYLITKASTINIFDVPVTKNDVIATGIKVKRPYKKRGKRGPYKTTETKANE